MEDIQDEAPTIDPAWTDQQADASWTTPYAQADYLELLRKIRQLEDELRAHLAAC